VVLAKYGIRRGENDPLPRATLESNYGYLPLDAFDGREGPATDLYSLGACLLFALSHQEPANLGPLGEALNFQPYVNISAPFAQVLARLTAPKPEHRYRDAEELLGALQQLQPLPPGIAVGSPMRPWLTGAVLASLLIPLFYLFFRSSPPPVPPAVSVPVSQPATAALPEIGTEQAVYAQNQPITVLYGGLPGNAQDWITLVLAEADDQSRGAWAYTQGQKTGHQTFAGLSPGEYEARLYYDWPRGGRQVQARAVFRVTPLETVAPPESTDTQLSDVFDRPLIVHDLKLPPVTGQVWFDGQPLPQLTALAPKFWFRNEVLNRVEEPQVIYRDGRFQISGLPLGKIGMQTSLNFDTSNPPFYPGDFYAWSHFTVAEDAPADVTVELKKVMRLLSPQDNRVAMADWDAECMDKPSFRGPVRLAWESLGENVVYQLRIDRMDCLNHYNSAGPPALETTLSHETTWEADLPPSHDHEVYGLHLSAKHQGRSIGLLMTHGSNGMGWDYRFRVE
jgi:hypothetical protein